MGKFLDTRGESVLSPYICDRCHLRGKFSEMRSDDDNPALWVHRECSDQLDPWKLPPRQSEDVSIPHPRPDAKPSDTDVFLSTNDYDNEQLTDNQGNPLTP